MLELDGPEADLTEREQLVLEMLATPRTYAAIADELCVSVNTVKTHVAHVYMKLGVTTRGTALQRAHERGLLARETRFASPLASRGVIRRRNGHANMHSRTVYLLWQSEPDGELLLGVYTSLDRARHVLATAYEQRPFAQHLGSFRISACRVDEEPDDARRRVRYEHRLVNCDG